MPQVRKNGVPVYKQIQATIVKRLEGGLLKPGDIVDSERELARIHGVSLMTARQALTALEREGLVVRRRGAGICCSTQDPFQQADELHGTDVRPRLEHLFEIAGSECRQHRSRGRRASCATRIEPPHQIREAQARRRRTVRNRNVLLVG